MTDRFGNCYKHYKGMVYITDGTCGNAAIINNGKINVVFFGELTEENIEKQFKASGLEYALEENKW